jgi:hypothetical protein
MHGKTLSNRTFNPYPTRATKHPNNRGKQTIKNEKKGKFWNEVKILA